MTTTFLRVPKHLLALGLLLAAETAHAQTTPAPAPAAEPVAVGVRRTVVTADTPPEPSAEEEVTRLTGQLALSPEQVTQVRAATLTKHRAYQALLRKYNEMHYVGRVPPAEGQAIEAQFEAQLQVICTPAQNQKYQTMKARFRRIGARADSLRRVAPAPASGGPK